MQSVAAPLSSDDFWQAVKASLLALLASVEQGTHTKRYHDVWSANRTAHHRRLHPSAGHAIKGACTQNPLATPLLAIR